MAGSTASAPSQSLLSIRRAGAQVILTYYALEAADPGGDPAGIPVGAPSGAKDGVHQRNPRPVTREQLAATVTESTSGWRAKASTARRSGPIDQPLDRLDLLHQTERVPSSGLTGSGAGRRVDRARHLDDGVGGQPGTAAAADIEDTRRLAREIAAMMASDPCSRRPGRRPHRSSPSLRASRM